MLRCFFVTNQPKLGEKQIRAGVHFQTNVSLHYRLGDCLTEFVWLGVWSSTPAECPLVNHCSPERRCRRRWGAGADGGPPRRPAGGRRRPRGRSAPWSWNGEAWDRKGGEMGEKIKMLFVMKHMGGRFQSSKEAESREHPHFFRIKRVKL